VELGLGVGAVVASMQWEETETAPNWTATFVPTATLNGLSSPLTVNDQKP
jgi:hypothetical protein